VDNQNVEINKYFSFIVPYMQENLHLMLIVGLIYGIMRIFGAIGLLKNRMWGFVISVILCVITMALMVFMLPAGIMDGILSCTTLLLIFMEYYKKDEIKNEK
jgi:uncharacterized membrane protein (DUF2068 family)